ncbi:thioesterase family protein [Nocardioides panacisoli]|uniref:acyl-CoA thioesterase n=1 Tax=Nocardioides panacisoli TaxID=627624 RepID=UPI001C63B542|nr:thioesterase family protein [Nocardioides panacisoli]QYJ03662.1 thioesterase family protein [Nocardioides panacisoli]
MSENHPTVTFECEIQARLRDVNLGGHVDNVEAIRVLDEARLLFLRFAEVAGSGTGLLGRLPDGVVELVGSQRVDYHAEMRFVPFQPFLVRMWVSHVGRTSVTVSSELRVGEDHPPAVVSETAIVLWDAGTNESWPISEEVRADLAAYAGEPVTLRERPSR